MCTLAFRAGTSLVLLTALLASPAVAQWSSDAANNLSIADRNGEQAQAKLAPTADGGFYVSWFDNSSGGYDVALQRLDKSGHERFPHNGVRIAERHFSSTQDYGLSIDAAGNALLAYRFEVDGVVRIAAQKTQADGTPLWGKNGTLVSSAAGDANSPKIAAAGDGTVGVAWSGSDGAIVVQKLDTAGAPLWGTEGVSIVPPSGFFYLADLHGDADGNLIVSWGAQLSMYNRQMWAQKLAAADGARLWGNDHVKVSDNSDGILQMGYFPRFIADGSGGAVFVWYTMTTMGTVHAQHIRANGTAAFPQNGVLASTDTSRNHFEPDGAYDASSGDIYVVWREVEAMFQNETGVYAQRIDSSGARQWGEEGKVLVPMDATSRSQLRALPLAGGTLLAWVTNDSPNPMPIQVARLDAAGAYVWPGQTVGIKTAATSTTRLAAALSRQGYAAYAWTDASGMLDGDIKAQNIQLDGSLGNPPPVEEIFANGFE